MNMGGDWHDSIREICLVALKKAIFGPLAIRPPFVQNDVIVPGVFQPERVKKLYGLFDD